MKEEDEEEVKKEKHSVAKGDVLLSLPFFEI